MIEQLKAEIKAIRTPLTLITLISAYILFISLSLITGDLFLGIVFGMSISFIILMKISRRKHVQIQDRIKAEFGSENTVMVSSSISFFKSALYITSFFSVIKLCLIVAPHSTEVLPSVGISFCMMSILLIGINGQYDWKKIHKFNKSNDIIPDEYEFTHFNIELPKSDTWHEDPCLIGNPIYHQHR